MARVFLRAMLLGVCPIQGRQQPDLVMESPRAMYRISVLRGS